MHHVPVIYSLFPLLKSPHSGGCSVVIKGGFFLSFLFRHRATSTTATAATSPTSASPTATPTSSPWAGRTLASFSGGWWEAGWATAGRDWPLPPPPPPAPQNLPPARRDTVMNSDRGGSVYTQPERHVSQWTAATVTSSAEPPWCHCCLNFIQNM